MRLISNSMIQKTTLFFLFLSSLFFYQNCGQGLQSLKGSGIAKHQSLGPVAINQMAIVSGVAVVSDELLIEAVTENSNSNTAFYWSLDCEGDLGDIVEHFSFSGVFKISCPTAGWARISVKVTNPGSESVESSMSVYFKEKPSESENPIDPDPEDPVDPNPEVPEKPKFPVVSLSAPNIILSNQLLEVKANISELSLISSMYWVFTCPGESRFIEKESVSFSSHRCSNSGKLGVDFYVNLNSGEKDHLVASVSIIVEDAKIVLSVSPAVEVDSFTEVQVLAPSYYEGLRYAAEAKCPNSNVETVDLSSTEMIGKFKCPEPGTAFVTASVYSGSSELTKEEVEVRVKEPAEELPVPVANIEMKYSNYLAGQGVSANFEMLSGDVSDWHWELECPSAEIQKLGFGNSVKHLEGCGSVGSGKFSVYFKDELSSQKTFQVERVSGLAIVISKTNPEAGELVRASVTGTEKYHGIEIQWTVSCSSSSSPVPLGKGLSTDLTCDLATEAATIKAEMLDVEKIGVSYSGLTKTIPFVATSKNIGSISLSNEVYLRHQYITASYTRVQGANYLVRWTLECPGEQESAVGIGETISRLGSCAKTGGALLRVYNNETLLAHKRFLIEDVKSLQIVFTDKSGVVFDSVNRPELGELITATIIGHDRYEAIGFIWHIYCGGLFGVPGNHRGTKVEFKCDRMPLEPRFWGAMTTAKVVDGPNIYNNPKGFGATWSRVLFKE